MFERFGRGTFRLIRFVLRRERLRILFWLIGLIGMSIMVPIAFKEMYSTTESMQSMAIALRNPAMVAIVGPSAGLDNYTIGAMNAHEMFVFMAIAIAIMNIFLVVRYTRRDEELGRQEVVRSLPVGRLSTLFATLGVAKWVNIFIGLGIGLGLTSLGIESIDFAGSMLYGASITAIGMLFAAIAAVFAQLSSTARGAIGMSMVFLIGSYLLRAVGDMNSEILSLISPLGLVLRTEAAVNNHWWPVFILIIEIVVVTLLAFWLNSIRDIDRGFIPARPGRAKASKTLVKPIGLSLRLMKGTLIAWSIGLLLLGASYGSILGDTESFADTIATMTGGVAEGGDIARVFVSVLMLIVSLCACIPCLSMILKLRGEERRGRLEMILAGSVSRVKIFLSYITPTLIFSFIAVIISVFGLWGAGVATMETPIPFGEMFEAVIVYMPAIWMLIGLATFLIGFWPKRSGLIWIFLTFSFFVMYLGKMMNLPEWINKLTPFGYVPQTMVEASVNYTPLIITAILAIILIYAGLYGYKRREMAR